MSGEDKIITAAKCPNCKKYHFVSVTEHLDKEGKKQIAEYVAEGFDVVHTTVEDARDNFSYCKES